MLSCLLIHQECTGGIVFRVKRKPFCIDFLLVLWIVTSLLACKNDKNVSEKTGMNENVKDSIVQDTDLEKMVSWTAFENAENNKPSDVSLMEANDLQSRIKAMLKDNYAEFQSDWKEETPIVIQDKILFTTGCQSGDCKANKYVLIVDFTDNNINIVNFKYGKVRSWEERAVIGLPDKLLQQFESIRKDQGL
jgi:hypothetical protein